MGRFRVEETLSDDSDVLGLGVAHNVCPPRPWSCHLSVCNFLECISNSKMRSALARMESQGRDALLALACFRIGTCLSLAPQETWYNSGLWRISPPRFGGSC